MSTSSSTLPYRPDRRLLAGSTTLPPIIVSTGATTAAAGAVITVTDLERRRGSVARRSRRRAEGQVVGLGPDRRDNSHAFLWRRGRWPSLRTLGGANSDATAINDRGQIVRSSPTGESGRRGFYRPFLWIGG